MDLATRILEGIDPVQGREYVDGVEATDLVERLIDSGRLETVVGTEEEFKPLIVSGEHLYVQKMFYLENRFVRVLRCRLAVSIKDWEVTSVERAMSGILLRPALRNGQALTLNDEQVAAVRAATRGLVVIISGGPGSGKTTIVLSILRMLRRLGVACEEIALAAPTGKAAYRMGEANRSGLHEIADPAPEDVDLFNLGEPQTLHRLLGYSQKTGSFIHHENNRLAERVVIIDESSMIDLALMDRLVRSLRDGSKLILLGDAHQLPSVEAGNVLRDLLIAGEENISGLHSLISVPLFESHRMRKEDENGRNILAVARAVDQGTKPTFSPIPKSDETIVERSSIAEITFRGVEFLSSGDESKIRDAFLDRWYHEQIRGNRDINELTQGEYRVVEGRFNEADQASIGHCFEYLQRFRILCLTRVSMGTGADHVNTALHGRLLDDSRLSSQQNDDFVAGEPVMMQINDYKRGIFNGDQGIILNVAGDVQTEPMAVFLRRDGFVAFQVDSLRSVLGHSYAMTVHKAQGSEFDTVGVILPDRDLPINTREIIYTALTRSRQGVVIVGDHRILEAGINRTIARDSGIVTRLRDVGH